MRAVVLREHGDESVLHLEDVPDPTPGPEEVLVDVAASALNRADLLQRAGRYPGPPADIEVPGLEFSGRVAATGTRVTAWRAGDAVMGIVAAGGHAERLVTHERMCVAVPGAVAVEDGAAIPEVYITAHDALVTQGGLTAGRTALVHAGASGVGTAAILIAGAMGARIIVTCSSSKVEACRALGADVVVDYTTTDFRDAVRDHTGGDGVDVVLDVVGGEYTERNLDCLKRQGRIVQVGVMGDPTATVPLGKLLQQRASLVGTVLRSRPLEQKIDATQRFAAELLPLFSTGRLRPVIDRRYRLDDIADAHRYMATNANVGKIVLDV
jgi:putative PIG3 family NAD(P)H quinone oxidoreductase